MVVFFAARNDSLGGPGRRHRDERLPPLRAGLTPRRHGQRHALHLPCQHDLGRPRCGNVCLFLAMIFCRDRLRKTQEMLKTNACLSAGGVFSHPALSGLAPQACAARAGDVVFHNGLGVHGAGANMTTGRRRAMTIALMPVRETRLFEMPCCTKSAIILPRQARHKHSVNKHSKQRRVCFRHIIIIGRAQYIQRQEERAERSRF